MPRISPLWLGHLLLRILLCTLPVGAAVGQRLNSPEYALKAAFIYNFALFTKLPGAAAKKTLTLCILGRDPFGLSIDDLDGKTVDTAVLTIRRIRSTAGNTGCQILYVTDAEVASYLSSSTPGKDDVGVLTISDKEGAAHQGIMIELTTENNKVGFEFNQEIARINQVQISSKLLRLARKVY